MVPEKGNKHKDKDNGTQYERKRGTGGEVCDTSKGLVSPWQEI